MALSQLTDHWEHIYNGSKDDWSVIISVKVIISFYSSYVNGFVALEVQQLILRAYLWRYGFV